MGLLVVNSTAALLLAIIATLFLLAEVPQIVVASRKYLHFIYKVAQLLSSRVKFSRDDIKREDKSALIIVADKNKRHLQRNDANIDDF